MNIGPIWWDKAYVSAELSAEAEQYKFDHNNIPDDANVPTPKSADWGTKDMNAYHWYPGKDTLFPLGTVIYEQDPRGNLQVNGSDHTISAQFASINAPVGTTVAFEFGIPGDVSPGAPE